jgi:hypothetical protein
MIGDVTDILVFRPARQDLVADHENSRRNPLASFRRHHQFSSSCHDGTVTGAVARASIHPLTGTAIGVGSSRSLH